MDDDLGRRVIGGRSFGYRLRIGIARRRFAKCSCDKERQSERASRRAKLLPMAPKHAAYPTRSAPFRATLRGVGKGFVEALVLVALSGVGCDGEYSLAPTPCDDYCLAVQRAGCDEDWPDDCVRRCEFTRSPTLYPNCTDDFDTLVRCYRALDDSDFTCQFDESEPRPGFCESEEREQNFCIEPILYRCIELCSTRGERCANVEPNECFRGCIVSSNECESERTRYLDCELADTTACGPSPSCTELSVELSECLSA